MRSTVGALLLALAASGCDNAAPAPPVADTPGSPATRHSSAHTPHSNLTGRVVWAGPIPHLAPVTFVRTHADGSRVMLSRSAPNVPAVGLDGGVAGAVVYLRGVAPAIARPWDRPPVTVELHDERPMIRQGGGPPASIGFVRRGDEITIVSRQSMFHSLRARGAAFWTVTLPDANLPRTRRLDQPGVVELSSGANYYWMRGYVWICEHPYYVATDAGGRWTLNAVPAGEYDLVAWLPNWRLERQERDPETGQVVRYVLQPPVAVTRRVVVKDNESVIIGDVPISP